jgi:hypothetical protein
MRHNTEAGAFGDGRAAVTAGSEEQPIAPIVERTVREVQADAQMNSSEVAAHPRQQRVDIMTSTNPNAELDSATAQIACAAGVAAAERSASEAVARRKPSHSRANLGIDRAGNWFWVRRRTRGLDFCRDVRQVSAR